MIKLLIKKFDSIKIRNKLILCFLSLSLVSMSAMGIYVITSANSFMTRQTEENVLISSGQLAANITNMLDEYIRLSNLYYTDTYLQTLLMQKNLSDFEMLLLYQGYINPSASNFGRVHDVNRLSIYATNPYFIKDGGFIIDINDFPGTRSYTEVMESRSGLVWSPIYEIRGEQVFYMFRLLNIVYGTAPAGILLVEIPQKGLYNLFAMEVGDTRIYLVNPDGYIITSSEHETVGQKINETEISEVSELPERVIHNLSINGNSYNVITESLNLSHESDGGKWQLLYFVSVDDMLSSVNSVVMGSILVSVVTLLVTAVFILIISDGLTKKIRYLSQNIGNIKEQDFEGFITVDGTDEIGVLANDINLMAARINELINQVYKEQFSKMDILVKQREAELQALQSKINPHFLYNTLDSIRSNFMLDEKEKAAILLASLSKLFRYSIGQRNDVATVKQEFINVDDYMEVYRIRYGEQIGVNINILKAIEDSQMPRLTMQPIVENSFIHGLKSKKSGFKIDITGKLSENGSVIITIKDNGAGLDEDALNKLRISLNEPDPGGDQNVGMRNVNDRLKLYFGKQYGLFVDSSYGNWFEVKIEMPYERERDA